MQWRQEGMSKFSYRETDRRQIVSSNRRKGGVTACIRSQVDSLLVSSPGPLELMSIED